jgi:Predicted metal-dependent RNase, consists of a metallo-beta-lactamase domain and an RNA-binding KH domain
MKNWVSVKCHVEKVEGFSAHADWQGVLRWLSGLPAAPKTIFLTHGEPEGAQAMAEHIKQKFGWNTMIPEYGQRVELE